MPAQGRDPSCDLNTDPLLAGVPVAEGYKVLGGVVLYQKLGAGGMGAVYTCHSLPGVAAWAQWLALEGGNDGVGRAR